MKTRRLLIRPVDGHKHLALHDLQTGEILAGCINFQLVNEKGAPLKVIATFIVDGENVVLSAIEKGES